MRTTDEKRIGPAINEAETQNETVGNRATSNCPTVREYPDRITLSAEAEQYLEHLADDICLGRVNLWQFSPALLALYTVGHEHGRSSRDHEVANLEALADRHYLRAYNSPAKIREIHQRAIDGAAAESARRFFGEVAA